MAAEPTSEAKPANTLQSEQARRLNMKETMIPSAFRARPQLSNFSFSMPTNNDDHSIVSNITMSTTLTDRDLSSDVYDFLEVDANADDANDLDNLEQASQKTPQANCFPFEKTLDTVFFKIYEAFLDEEAMMWVCQDEPSEGTPILDYPASNDGIPAVASTNTQEEISPEERTTSGGMLQKNVENYRSSSLSVEGYSPSITKQGEEDSKGDPATKKTRVSTQELDAVVPTTESQVEDIESPWRLDSLLNSSPDVTMSKSWARWKDESIEVNDTGCVVFDDTFDTVEFEATAEVPIKQHQSAKTSSKRNLSLSNKETYASMSLSPADSVAKKDNSFGSYETAPTFNQTSFDTVEISPLKSPLSKKRSLGLRYLFSPRMRKLISWKRHGPKKYQNMKKLDDPSYSPETVTTFAQTCHSDGLSFQCDMSSKLSVMNSIKQDPLQSPQKSTFGSRSMDESGSLSYAYPQSMVA
jgi:hypothetical protein